MYDDFPYPRGSEWRKWDLHLHTPGTKKNDQYRLDSGDVWDEFCQKLKSSDVKVFGITDYFSYFYVCFSDRTISKLE